MRIRKAFWTASLALPATIIPLSTATSCSQAWGYKTPISIGTSVKGSSDDPFCEFATATGLVDLNGDKIVPTLQSNYAVDNNKSMYYAYGLPEKWDADLENEGWKGGFKDGAAGWYDANATAYEKSGTKKKDKKSETVVSYRNNTLASNSAFVGQVGANISQFVNYALQYQGTQLGSEYGQDENLAIAWGADTFTHGAKDSEDNRNFIESIFASNAVSGQKAAKALVHPTYVNFIFNKDTFPVVAYTKVDERYKVNDATLKLLNGVEPDGTSILRPSKATNKYYSTYTDSTEKEIKDDVTTTCKYRTYTFTNVPIVVNFTGFIKGFVNPRKNDSFLVDDFYSSKNDIKETVGSSWKGVISKHATGSEEPTIKRYIYEAAADSKITPLYAAENYDKRIPSTLKQNDFIVLANYAYKECTSVEVSSGTKPAEETFDRASMTDLVTVFPAYYLDNKLKLEDTTFFTKATGKDANGYILDIKLINKYNNLYMELMRRSAGQGLITKAKDLNDTSKKLLKFLAFQFGDRDQETGKFTINTGDTIEAEPIEQ